MQDRTESYRQHLRLIPPLPTQRTEEPQLPPLHARPAVLWGDVQAVASSRSGEVLIAAHILPRDYPAILAEVERERTGRGSPYVTRIRPELTVVPNC